MNGKKEPMQRDYLPKLKALAAICAIVALAAKLGFISGVARQDSRSVLKVEQMPGLETYVTAKSFSEVENDKANFQALAEQWLTDLRIRHSTLPSGSTAKSRSDPMYALNPEAAIQELERGIKEFQGTGQEWLLVQELLRLLKKEKSYDHWLDVYLQALYQHPTGAEVARFADEAVRISKLLGREHELFNGLEHLSQIPFDFPARQQAQATLSTVHLADGASPGKPVL
jgi:hypothetical protein